LEPIMERYHAVGGLDEYRRFIDKFKSKHSINTAKLVYGPPPSAHGHLSEPCAQGVPSQTGRARGGSMRDHARQAPCSKERSPSVTTHTTCDHPTQRQAHAKKPRQAHAKEPQQAHAKKPQQAHAKKPWNNRLSPVATTITCDHWKHPPKPLANNQSGEPGPMDTGSCSETESDPAGSGSETEEQEFKDGLTSAEWVCIQALETSMKYIGTQTPSLTASMTTTYLTSLIEEIRTNARRRGGGGTR
jgi:hypothetical protein